VMSGQGFAGILAAVFKLCINFWWYTNIETSKSSLLASGLLNFGVAALVILIVAFCCFLLTKSEFYCYYSNQSSRIAVSIIDDENFMNEIKTSPDTEIIEASSKLEVLKKIKWDAFHVFHVFLITLVLFPGFTTRIHNYDHNLIPANHALILISIFQLMDLVGRTIPKWIVFPSADKLWLPTWLRVIFIPLFMISIYTDWFPHNAISYTVMILFALTNGYISTLLVMSGPNRVSLMDSKTAGTLMSVFLQLGIFLGVNLAMILVVILEGADSVVKG